MKPLLMGSSGAATKNELRHLVSDLFHQLSQPLTTLCCSLELALLQTPTAQEYGEIVLNALVQAERVSALAIAMRELLEASEAGDDGEMLELRAAVAETIGDLLLVADAAGVEICYRPQSAGLVWFDAPRLRRGLFHLLGFVIGSTLPGAVLKIELAEHETSVNLALMASREGVCDPPPPTDREQELLRKLGLGIACAIFTAAGGSFCMQRDAECLNVEVRLLRSEIRSSQATG